MIKRNKEHLVMAQKIWVPLLLALLLGCEKEPENQNIAQSFREKEMTTDYLYEIMRSYYLWESTMPKNPDFGKNIYNFLDELRYKPLDIWSFIIPTSTYFEYFEGGRMTGYGFGFAPDDENHVRVSYVFDDSPLKKAGITRGWKILSVDNTSVNINNIGALLGNLDVDTQQFEVENLNGETRFFTFSKDTVEINTVLLDTVFNINNKKVGYLVFKSFIETSKQELLESFGYFKDNEIDELIVDLRYNGGGRADIGVLLGGLIAGENVKNETMVQYLHNSNHTDEDISIDFSLHENSLNLRRVVFIATKNTASASEMLINGLDPFIEVVQVGDETHGKPVGMYSWVFKDFTVLPVSFKIANATGFGEFFNGLPADAYVADDLTRAFGDTSEFCLNQSLYYIEHGEFPASAQLKSARRKTSHLKGWQLETGAY
jgi:carboxyl-terminal processing protease